MGNMCSTMCYRIFWLSMLGFVAIWVAMFCAAVFLSVSWLTPCLPALKDCTDLSLAGMLFPQKCTENFIKGRPFTEF
jgi:hypothetical protein